MLRKKRHTAVLAVSYLIKNILFMRRRNAASTTVSGLRKKACSVEEERDS